ncbi:hypothetical protein [Terasakiella sp.]|uniref:hypothetical protein n=1 Tax=Terasakiella sp. TaxID=2034861 RepID=UPI003AA8DAB7
MGYRPGLWLYDEVQLEEYPVLVKNFDTEMKDGICFVKITGIIIISDEFDEAQVELIKTFDRATSMVNGVVADIWNVKVSVDRDEIMTIDLDALQESMLDDNKN